MGTGLSIGNSMFASQPWMMPTNIGMYSPMSMGTSIYSSGTSSSYSSSNETAEQREKRLEREIEKKNKAIDEKIRKEQQALITQMQQNPDMFSELTDEEEKILLDYMCKVDKVSEERGYWAEGLEVGQAAFFYVPMVAMGGKVLSHAGSGLSWCGKKVGLDKVGNYVSNSSSGKWVSKTYNAAKNSKAVTGTKNFFSSINSAPANIVDKAATGVQMGEKATKVVNGCKNFTGAVATKGAAAAAIVTVVDDIDELSVAYKDGFGSGLKQTGQTAVKAGAAAGGFWLGAKGGAAAGAAIGGFLGPVGAAIGGAIGGLLGGLLGSWGAKKAATALVGQDVGAKIRDQQALEVAKAEKGTELSENQMVAVGNVITFAQQDQEIDEKTLAVLNKLAAKTGMA